METVTDIADRVDRAGDRYRNAQDFEREDQSRIAAAAIRATSDLNAAREMARAFELGLKLDENEQTAPTIMAISQRRRPWWKWWKSNRTNYDSDGSDDS
jgi:hypothetical protein